MNAYTLRIVLLIAFASFMGTEVAFAKAPSPQYVAKYVHGSHLHKGHSGKSYHHSSRSHLSKNLTHHSHTKGYHHSR